MPTSIPVDRSEGDMFSPTVEKAKPLHIKTISRRVRRLEESFAPQENGEVGRLVTLLRERRRRRLEAASFFLSEREFSSLRARARRCQKRAKALRSSLSTRLPRAR